MKILDVKVLARHDYSTDLNVKCHYDGADYEVRTELREGRDLPNTELIGYSASPDSDFIVALHEALDEQCAQLVGAEIDRICG